LDGYNIAASRSAEAEVKRTTIARYVVSTIGNQHYKKGFNKRVGREIV
jgi:hypothetical protein